MVPTCYGRQAILHEFEGLKTSSMSALIDSNRAVERKVLLCVLFGCLHIVQVRLQISVTVCD